VKAQGWTPDCTIVGRESHLLREGVTLVEAALFFIPEGVTDFSHQPALTPVQSIVYV